MKANKRLIELLQYNSNDYQMIVFELFYQWCVKHSFSDQHAQKLLHSQKLYDWFLREHKLQESNFINYTKDYATRVVIDLRKFYLQLVIEKLNYPQAILTKLRKEYNKETMSKNIVPYHNANLGQYIILN